MAQERGFEYVGTTLAVSPYQLFETCNDVLERLAAACGLTPVIRDFRPYYPEATRRSRELGMYRQNYCGSRLSRRPWTAPASATSVKPPKSSSFRLGL